MPTGHGEQGSTPLSEYVPAAHCTRKKNGQRKANEIRQENSVVTQ